MEKFLSFLISVVLFFWILKFVFALVGPWLLRFFVRRTFGQQFADAFAQQQADEQPRQQQPSADNEQPTVKTHDGFFLRVRLRQGQTLSDLLGGEYVDFQEVGS